MTTRPSRVRIPTIAILLGLLSAAAAAQPAAAPTTATQVREVSYIFQPLTPRMGGEKTEATVAKLNELREDLIAGRTDFATAAREHSAAPSAASGGRIGSVTRGAPYNREFLDLAFATPVNGYSQVTRLPNGAYLLHVTAESSDPAAATVARSPETTLTQLWVHRTANVGGPSWFDGGGMRTVRGAAYKADVDKVLVVRRPTPQVAELRKLDPVTGAELVDSPTPLLDQGDGIAYGTLCATMIDTADDDVLFFCNLTTRVDRDRGAEPFIIYRMANDSDFPTTAVEVRSYPRAQPPVLPELAGCRLGDTFEAVGSGTATELFTGVSYGAGMVAGAQELVDLVRFSTVDGSNFRMTGTFHLSDPVLPFDADAPNRLGLAAISTPDGPEIWGAASGGLLVPRRWNLSTLKADVRLTTETVSVAGGHTGMGLRVVNGRKVLVLAPGVYTSPGPYGGPLVHDVDVAQRAFALDVTDPGNPLILGRTHPLGVHIPAADPPWQPNPDGTCDVFFDTVRNNFGVVLTNNTISMHSLAVDGGEDWNLY